jgi:hypothetical protein
MRAMTVKSLSESTVDELVDRFAEACVGQDSALINLKVAMFNKLYKQMDSAEKELRKRGKDARFGLLRLYQHPNPQVRLQAARFTLGIAPVEARQAIEAIARAAPMPYAADARGTLRALDEGVFKPD